MGKLLTEPRCRLLTITGLGGIGKTRMAIELALTQQTLFPGGVYYVSLASLNSPEFIVPAIAEVFGFSFSGAADPEEQLLNHLAVRSGQPLLLVLDNLEHLLCHPSEQDGKDETIWLLTKLVQRLPNVKILATSRERSNLREEWIFELHGLPVPMGDQTNRLEDFSSVALFLQRARQLKVDFEVLPHERPSLARICQLVEGTPLAIELAATWVTCSRWRRLLRRSLPTWISWQPRCGMFPSGTGRYGRYLPIPGNCYQMRKGRCSAGWPFSRVVFSARRPNEIAGASLPILMSLHSKSLLMRREEWRYDLHALIRQCALEKLHDNGYLEETCHKHLAYFVSMAHDAHQGLRSA